MFAAAICFQIIWRLNIERTHHEYMEMSLLLFIYDGTEDFFLFFVVSTSFNIYARYGLMGFAVGDVHEYF